MPMWRACIGDKSFDRYLFDSGVKHLLLPAGWLSGEENAQGGVIRLRLAAGDSTEGMVVNREVYAPGAEKGLLVLTGRSCRRLGVCLSGGGASPGLFASGARGVLPVVWAHTMTFHLMR